MNPRKDVRVAVQSLGCKVNQYEALKVEAQFSKAGYRICSAEDEADVYIVNTCTVTHVADRSSRKLIRRMTRKNPKALLVVTGCHAEEWNDSPADVRVLKVPQLEKETLYQRVEENLFGFTPEIPDNLAYHTIPPFSSHPLPFRTRAYLKVQDGCDRFCTYCIIPFIRGRSRSRPVSEILEEARQLMEEGYREIVVTGICVGDYGRDLAPRTTLSSLIEKLLELPYPARLRLSSIDPCDMDEKLVEWAAGHPRFCNHLHLALQHGSDRILKRMGRDYTRQEFFLLVRELKRKNPRIAITTDIIAGFPGEKEIDFQETLDLARAAGFSKIHVFPYSERKGTGAVKHKGKVPAEIRERRTGTLLSLSNELTEKFYSQSLGSEGEVLVEHQRDRVSGLLQGYTSNYIPVILEGLDELMGKMICVELVSLFGKNVLAKKSRRGLIKHPANVTRERKSFS